ncbi:hypothetical protein GGE24_005162 [Bradyrhizobium centrosematis]|nr:hypothetical protein [Bradyrhizobium centrosematis]MCS3775823.1 hypothetical protein [Bradyrhizobium centrosematis]
MSDRAVRVREEVLHAVHWVAGSQSEKLGIQAMRIAIAIIFLWIGALKFVPYEADSITPFVANNPVMQLFTTTQNNTRPISREKGNSSLPNGSGKRRITPTAFRKDLELSRWPSVFSLWSVWRRHATDSLEPFFRS